MTRKSATPKNPLGSQFRTGAGVYECRCCLRRTRGNLDSADLHLCSECYDLAGYENMLSDSGAESVSESDRANIRALYASIMAKGNVKAGRWSADILAIVGEGEQAPAPALEAPQAAQTAPAATDPQADALAVLARCVLLLERYGDTLRILGDDPAALIKCAHETIARVQA